MSRSIDPVQFKPGDLVMVMTPTAHFLAEVIAIIVDQPRRMIVMDLGTGKPCDVESMNCRLMADDAVKPQS